MEQQGKKEITPLLYEAYKLRVIHGLHPLDCAKALGCSPQALDNLLRRLRECGYDVPKLKNSGGPRKQKAAKTADKKPDKHCRCGLRLPCNKCLNDPDYKFYAIDRRLPVTQYESQQGVWRREKGKRTVDDQ